MEQILFIGGPKWRQMLFKHPGAVYRFPTIIIPDPSHSLYIVFRSTRMPRRIIKSRL
jgi:hypothetical protein